MQTKQNNDPNVVEQYRAELNLENTKITLTGPSSTQIQNCVRQLYADNPSQIRFQKSGENSHTIYFQEQLIGWMTVSEIPTILSYEHQKKAVEKVAA